MKKTTKINPWVSNMEILNLPRPTAQNLYRLHTLHKKIVIQIYTAILLSNPTPHRWSRLTRFVIPSQDQSVQNQWKTLQKNKISKLSNAKIDTQHLQNRGFWVSPLGITNCVFKVLHIHAKIGRPETNIPTLISWVGRDGHPNTDFI